MPAESQFSKSNTTKLRIVSEARERCNHLRRIKVILNLTRSLWLASRLKTWLGSAESSQGPAEALGAKSLALLYPAVLGDGYQASVLGTNRKVHAQAPTCTEGRKGARNVAENKFLKKRLLNIEQQQVIQRFPGTRVTSALLESVFTHTGGRSREL